jgi:O-acetyl-ADP-ribose deacetylase (regulator of RNase III)
MDFRHKGKTIKVVLGDITRVKADAIVNAANEGLRGGGGVDGAIHRAGGPTIMEECRKIGRCPTGEAVITGGGRLPAKHVIHTVGPVWAGGGNREKELLASAYRTSLAIAEQRGLTSIAFPSVSTGIYGFPIRLAAPIAVEAVVKDLERTTGLREVQFVLFSQADYEVYVEVVTDFLGR